MNMPIEKGTKKFSKDSVEFDLQLLEELKKHFKSAGHRI